MMLKDVPSPIDLRRMPDALAWTHSAMTKRPGRVQFFECFLAELQALPVRPKRILELGSGPGFLAEHILSRWVESPIEYVALDFSAAMHKLAAERLTGLGSVVFVERNFKDSSWWLDLGHFDAVLTIQAVHELRHKRYASSLHAQVRRVLTPNAPYLVCDHHAGEGGMKNTELYLSLSEHESALLSAGFIEVRQVRAADGMVLNSAT